MKTMFLLMARYEARPLLPIDLVRQDFLDSSCKRNTWFEGLDFVGHCFGGRSPAEGLSGAIVQQRSHFV